FPRSWEDIPSFTIPAEWHYRVAEVLVKEGAVIEAGTRLLTLDILEEEEEAADEDLDDSAPANKKHKVNDIGQPKRVTLTAQSSCLVAEVMVVKGTKVKPRQPLYALKYPDMQV
ncbi:hypothetical protein Tco_1322371, partial [Tanacetum coccineum]